MNFLRRILDMEKAKEDFVRWNPMVTGIGLTPIPGVKKALESFSEEEQLKGKKEGYIQASQEYEDKLLKQAEKFLEQTAIFQAQKEEYEELLDMYERYIEELEGKDYLSQEEVEYLKQLLLAERKLRKMEIEHEEPKKEISPGL